MGSYFVRHLQVLFATLGDFRRTPLTTINTVLVIGITLLLPTLLYIVIKSGISLSDSWSGQPQFSIFLHEDISSDEAQLIFAEIKLHPAIELAEFISPTQALAEFREISGLDFELDYLGENPLPASIVVLPNDGFQNSSDLLSLKSEIGKIEGIEDIRLDLDWTDRFNALINTVYQFTLVLSILLGVSLVLIVGNSIKLLIANRRQEIEITKLVGGSNAFVRRPFLYFGSLFGLFGALTTLGLLTLVSTQLHAPLQNLAELYGRDSVVYTLNWQEIGSLTLGSIALGWLAARTSLARHLGAIRPR